MKITFIILALLPVAFFAMVIAPSIDLAIAMAQIPPPELPGAPDQSVLWGPGLAAMAAIAFGIWRLRRRIK